jgi:TrmH family RNA methyltransferase
MNVNAVNSPSNALLKRIRSLHERKFREKERLFLIEGVRAVDEAFKKNLNVRDVLVSERFLDEHADELAAFELDHVTVVDERLFKESAMTTTPSGILAVAEMPLFKMDELFKQNKPLVVVNAVQDPGNLGTIMRTALAASAGGMILIRGTVDPFNPKVVRSAMGSLFALPIVWDVAYEQAMDELRRRGIKIIACDASADRYIFDIDLTGSIALVFGNEGNGFAAGQLEQVDEVVSIPMNPQSESLNVAMSAAVALFNVVQQRIKSDRS